MLQNYPEKKILNSIPIIYKEKKLYECLPPIVTKPESLTWIIWFRAIDCVSFLFGLRTSGRIPDHADRTSPRRTWTSDER